MQDKVFNVDQLDDAVFANMVKRRREEAEGHWNKDKKLASVRAENNKMYLSAYIEEQLIDERYQSVYSDNRQFVSVRTMLPFLVGRVTAPEVTPANGDDSSMQFAEDFEKALEMHAEKQMARGKIRLAVQDVLRGERIGYLKWCYNADTDTVTLEHVPAECVVIGNRSKLYEEPDFLSHTQKRSIGDLLRQFPDKEAKILELFDVEKAVPSQLEREVDITEDWMWVDIDGKKTLIVGWEYQNVCFGKMTDPNWNESGNNINEQSMIPFVFFNFLNNGKGWVDDTSFMEQAKWLQKNYDQRGQVIAESAKYGGTGVPIFAKGSISQKDVAKIRFSPIQRVLLDTTDVGKSFTQWQSMPLPNYIVEDKKEAAVSIDNIWGIPDILRGEQSGANTLGQDLLIRDQAEGRQADPIDCIDDSMVRFYLLEAQFMYRYFSESKYYNYIGNDGRFVSVVINNRDIRKNLGCEVTVKPGTSLPIDRAQKRAMIMSLLKMDRVSTLVAYKELGIFDDPEEAFKQYLKEKIIPFSVMSEQDDTVQSREAEQDLQLVIAGEKPVDRDDIEQSYLAHLNEYLLTNKYHMLKPKQQKRVAEFVQGVIQMAQIKQQKMQGQQPVNNPNSMMPPTRAKEAMNYKDAPPDVQKQMEINQGLQPSAVHDLEMKAGIAHLGTNTATILTPQGQNVPQGPQPPM